MRREGKHDVCKSGDVPGTIDPTGAMASLCRLDLDLRGIAWRHLARALTLMSVVAAAFTASSAAQAAICDPGKVSVATAQGGTTCITPSKTFAECVAASLRNGFSKARSESFCSKLFPR